MCRSGATAPPTKAPTGPRAVLDPHAFSRPEVKELTKGTASQASVVDVSDANPAVKQLTLKALSVHLKDTYRIINPERPAGCDAAPRRVLTHPSIPVANGCVLFFSSVSPTAKSFPLSSLSSCPSRNTLLLAPLLPQRT